MIFRMILPREVEGVWPEVAPLLAPAVALAEGETTMDLLLESLVAGVDTRLVVVTEDERVVVAGVLTMAIFPNKKVCQVSYAGGSRLDEWCDTSIQIIEKIAKDLGADAIYIQGRKGWVRRFRRHGFFERTTLICKELKE